MKSCLAWLGVGAASMSVVSACSGPAPPREGEATDPTAQGDPDEAEDVAAPIRMPTRALASARRHASSRRAPDNGIEYHGGPVLRGAVHLYYIWYGDWSTREHARHILQDFAANLGGSPYWRIEATYHDGVGPAGEPLLASCTDDRYSKGTALDDIDVGRVVSGVLEAGKLPVDLNGVYFVLTSPDVKETSGFCESYCGWHSHRHMAVAGVHHDIKFAFIGDPSQQCPHDCEDQPARSPNGDPAADAMATVVAHESEESVTDPDFGAWVDEDGQENADKCVWTFGPRYVVANGSKANVHLGERDYLIQRNWVNASGGYCALAWP